MNLWVALAMLAGGVALLYGGAEGLVRGGVRIASRLGVSPLVIGLTLVAAATSMPEMVVSVGAALKGSADIAVGNVVGSNICNIALILGLSALIAPLAVKTRLLRFDAPVLAAVTAGFALWGWYFGGFGRTAGLVMLAGFGLYLAWNIWASRREEKRDPAIDDEWREEIPRTPWRGGRSWLWCVMLVGLGVAALIFGAGLMVDAAVEIGRRAGLSEAVIGLTIVAVGTSLPELATSVVAACRREQDIAIGNVIGSNIFNILAIMGAAPLIRPLKTTGIRPEDWLVMTGLTLLLLPFMRTGWRLSRLEGAVLLALYIGYVAWLVAGVSA